MIAYINGTLAQKEPGEAVIDCNGVGYVLVVSLNTFSKLPAINHECKLYTHLNIREDAHVLFGFADNKEKNLFLQLITVNGVGPATAINILSVALPDELMQLISHSDVAALRRFKGIGPKTAERIVLELRDKMIKSGSVFTELPGSVGYKKSEALAVLIKLGVQRNQAEKMLDDILQSGGKELSVEELIKKALKPQ